jgi:hypothetical protein
MVSAGPRPKGKANGIDDESPRSRDYVIDRITGGQGGQEHSNPFISLVTQGTITPTCESRRKNSARRLAQLYLGDYLPSDMRRKEDMA